MTDNPFFTVRHAFQAEKPISGRLAVGRAQRRMEMSFMMTPTAAQRQAEQHNYCDGCKNNGDHHCTGKVRHSVTVFEDSRMVQKRVEVACVCPQCLRGNDGK